MNKGNGNVQTKTENDMLLTFFRKSNGRYYFIEKDKEIRCTINKEYKVNYSKYLFVSDISTLLHYSFRFKGEFNVIHYGLVKLLDVTENIARIKVLKFIPQDFSTLASYDQTGNWIVIAGKYNFPGFDVKTGLRYLAKVDLDGFNLCIAGQLWENFDYKLGMQLLCAIGDPKYIVEAGISWERFDYDKGLDTLLDKDDGSYIIYAGTAWDKFNHEKAISKLLELGYSEGTIKYQWNMGKERR